MSGIEMTTKFTTDDLRVLRNLVETWDRAEAATASYGELRAAFEQASATLGRPTSGADPATLPRSATETPTEQAARLFREACEARSALRDAEDAALQVHRDAVRASARACQAVEDADAVMRYVAIKGHLPPENA